MFHTWLFHHMYWNGPAACMFELKWFEFGTLSLQARQQKHFDQRYKEPLIPGKSPQETEIFLLSIVVYISTTT